MTTLTLTDPVTGTIIDSGVASSNNASLRTVINGNLDNANIKASANIDVTKLAPGSNGQLLGVTGGVATWGVASSAIVYDSGALGSAAANIDSGAGGFATTYTHLRVMFIGRSTSATTNVALTLVVNNDTGANYDMVGFQFWGGVATNYQTSWANGSGGGIDLGAGSQLLAGSTATAGIATTVVIDFPFYAQTAFKKKFDFRTNGIFDQAVNARMFQAFGSVNWRNTAAINRLAFIPGAGNLDVGSRMIVYGLS